MRSICIIPARMGSSRFPGKPLKPLLGMAMIQHIYLRCRLYSGFEKVVVATCDREIAEAVQAVGGEAVMTADSHERCTDRVQEALGHLALGLKNDDFVLMVQGDEIMVTPAMLEEIESRYRTSGADAVNLVSRLYSETDCDDPNTVKCVMAPDERILYFSRSRIPSRARAPEGFPVYQQTGIIGFRPSFLDRFSALPQTPLEKAESCDMMRLVEHGLPIYAVRSDIETIGIDTEGDRARAEQRLAQDPLTSAYLKP